MKDRLLEIAELTADFQASFAPSIAEKFFEENIPSGNGAVPSDLAGVTLGIEYKDTEGNITKRRVTLISLEMDKRSEPTLIALCLETKEMKHFNVGSIISVSDWATEQEYPTLDDFLRDVFQASLSVFINYKFAPLRLCRHGLIYLTALAHADNKLFEVEVDEIVKYCEAVCWSNHVTLDRHAREQIKAFAVRFKTFEEGIDTALAHFRRNPKNKKLLKTCAIKLMEADGVRSPEELEMIAAL